MKRFWMFALLLTLLAVCVAMPASAARELRDPSQLLTGERVTLPPTIQRDPCARGHNWITVNGNGPTCTEAGFENQKCSRCGETRRVKGDAAKGHDWNSVSGNGPSCTEAGFEIQKCSRCGDTKRVTGAAAKGHNYQYAQTNPALCESNGKEWFECTRCGDTQYQTIPKLGHDYRVTSTVDATCTKDGKKTYTCSRLGCGSQKSETIAANGNHKWIKDAYEEPDCGVKGTQYYYCSVCGDQKNESIPALEHDWKQVGVKEPTCGEKGAYYLKCRNCDREKTEERAATGNHKWVHAHTYRDDVECVAGGTAYYVCAGCGAQKSEAVSATGHKWKAVSALSATCDSPKTVTYQCSTCNAKKTEKEGTAAGHNWRIISTVEATCDTPKIVKSECRNCGARQEDQVGTAAGHKWKDGQIIKQPTCTEDGKASSVCERCGKTDSARVLEKLGHSYGAESVTKAATCTAAGEKQATCKTCGNVKKTTIKATGHNYGEWKVIKEATENATGTKARTCANCGNKETETIPKKVKPTPTPKPTKAPKPTKTPKPTATPQFYGMMEDGGIVIVSTSGKVNLRTGPGKKNGTAGQVAKKNTNLGNLVDAQVDSTGTVWYKVHYKGKNVWITSDYARAVIGDMTYSDDRHVGIDSVDLSDICFSYISEAADHYGLDLDMSGEASNNEICVSGSGDFVESIEIFGKGYALYGIEVGDKLKTVENSMKKNGLYCASKSSGVYVSKRPIQLYSMCVNDEGFDSYVEVVLDESKCVESISWNAYTE